MISLFLKGDALVLFICLELAHGKTTYHNKIIWVGALCVNWLSIDKKDDLSR